MAQTDGPEGLAAYRQSLALRETLVARDPANTQWRRDLALSHSRLGDMFVAQGDRPGGLAAYRHSLALFEALAALDPANSQWAKRIVRGVCPARGT